MIYLLRQDCEFAKGKREVQENYEYLEGSIYNRICRILS
jgi:hypothetical protein